MRTQLLPFPFVYVRAFQYFLLISEMNEKQACKFFLSFSFIYTSVNFIFLIPHCSFVCFKCTYSLCPIGFFPKYSVVILTLRRNIFCAFRKHTQVCVLLTRRYNNSHPVVRKRNKMVYRQCYCISMSFTRQRIDTFFFFHLPCNNYHHTIFITASFYFS